MTTSISPAMNNPFSLFSYTESASAYTAILDPLQLLVQERLTSWFGQADYLAQLAIPFRAIAGSEGWTANAEALRQVILGGDYSIRLEVRSGEELKGAFGAYSATGTTGTPTIYLNADWLATATSEQITAVLLEELGHSFDNYLNNGADSQGDEGEIFANLVLNTGVNTTSLLQQNDHQIVTIGGQQVAIEAAAWGPANVAQSFYLPMAENDVRASLFRISTAVGTDIRTVISMVSTSNGTVIVYDHWEDGYEADINNPTQATTQIWGDGNLSNGTAPGDADDLLVSGQVITLINTINIGNLTAVDYDGRDRIGATKAIAVTKAGWATTPGTVLAGAINIYDVGNSGKSYVIPIGQNTVTNNASPNDTANRLFEYTSLHIIAYENGTTVNVDLNGDGDTSDANEVVVNLSQGQSYLVNGNVLAGTNVTSNKAIGVYSIAGDVGSSYENRWLAITPTEQWYSSYYAPVSTTRADAPAHVFLYNPGSTAITVTYDTQATKGATIVVPAKGNAYVVMPASAAHFYTVGGEKFFAISTIDSDATANQAYDWSYSLVPESYLTDKFVVAWGPGYNNTDGVIGTAKNGSPVWVTAPKDTTIYIDYAGDGWNAGQGDITYNLKALESYRISDSDKDQSGLTVYTTDGTLITAAWGEDPSVADAGNPYLDMGTTVLPFPDYVLQKVSKEASPVIYGTGVSDNDTNVELGEQIEYTVSVTNRAVIDLFNVNIKDSIAPSDSATYVPNSTSFTIYDPNGNIVVSYPDLDGSGNSFPLSGSGYTITDADPNTPVIDGLKRGYQAVIKYRVQVRGDINQNLSTANYTITNNATLTGNPAGGDPINKTITNETQVVVNSYDGEVAFYKSDFSAVATSFQEGNTIGIQVTDRDPNKTSTTAETLTVTVTNITTGETELVTLTETGLNTGVFRGTLATSTNSANNGINSGTLYMVQGDSLKVEYTDPVFGTVFDNPTAPGIPQVADTTTTNPLLPSPGNNSDADTSTATGKANTANATVAVPSKTKILYLSADAADNDGTGDLDRINPADPNSNSSTNDQDTSTSSTVNITPAVAATGGGTGTYLDNFATQAFNNSNGTENWASNPWQEIGDDNSATAGNIRINSTLNFRSGSSDIQRQVNLSSADTSQAITLSFTFNANNLGDNTNERVDLNISTDGGTNWTTLRTFDNNNDGTYTVDIKSYVALNSQPIIRFDSNNISGGGNQLTIDDFQVSFTKTGTPATPAVPATFTQALSMADDFVIPSGGEIKVVTYISNITTGGTPGGTPVSGNITATLTRGANGTGNSIANLTSFTYTSINSTSGFITWIGTASGITIPAGEKVQLVITNNQSGLSFKVDYDSYVPDSNPADTVDDTIDKRSRIELSTTTVIDIEDVDNNAGNGVQEIGFYNNSFANNGSLITSGTVDAGQIVYLRVKVSDPFGDYDITGLTITLDGPDTIGDQTVTLTNANVINASGDGVAIKTYEYAWQTINNTGVYNITVVAKEGSEGITATATSSIIVTAQDLGTPSTTEFISGLLGSIPNQYNVNDEAFLRVTDLDENTSPTTIETVTAVVNGITVTLTETGANTGIFEADLSLQNSAFLNLPSGTVLNASYVDNDDATDTSNDTISVGNQPPTLDLDPTNGNTVNNTATFNEGAGTGVAFTQTGQSITDDSGNLANLKISFLTASISDGANETLQFSGATAGSPNITSLALNFATGGTDTVLIGGVTYLITRTVDLGTGLSTLTFTNNAGGNLTVAQTEALLDSLRYFNSSANPTDGNREFTAIVNDGSLNSNSTTFTVDVNPINDAPAGTDKGFNLASNSSITLTVNDFGFSDPNDSPANNLQAVKISSLPVTGTLSYNGVAITPAQITAGYFVSVNDINAGKLTYTAPGTAGTPSFTFQVQDDGGTANGGVDLDQSPNTITFTVAPNVPPVVDLNTADGLATLTNTATFTEVLGTDTGANAVNFTAGLINVTDADSPNLANLKVSIAQSQIATGDQLRFGNIIINLTTDPDTTPTSGEVTYNSTVFGYTVTDVGGDRIITFTSKAGIGGVSSPAPQASYEALIDALQYNNSSDGPVNGSTRNFSVTANDGQADSVTPAVFTVTIQATPEPPDIDLDLSVASKNHTDNFIENTTNGSQANAVPFVHGPSIGGNSLTDIDSLNLAFLTVSIDKTTLESGDQLLVGGQTINLSTSPASGTVTIGAVNFNYNVVDNGNTRTVTFSNSINGGIAALTAYEALLDTLKYNNSSNSLASNSSRIFSLATQDESGLASNTATFTVDITVSNGAPILDLDAGDTGTLNNVATFTEVAGTDTGANAVYFAKGMAVGNNQSGTNVADADSDLSNFKVSISQAQIAAGDQLRFGGVMIDLTTDPDTTPITGEVTYNSTVFRYTVSDDGSGNRILTFTSLDGSNGTATPAVIASYEALVDDLQYNSTSDTPSGSRTFSNTVTDSGNLTSPLALFTVTLNAVNDPPVAVDDSLSTNEDTALVITANDLFGGDGTGNSNDLDVDSANFASITITELATNGTLQFFNGSTWVDVADEQVITVANLTAGNFRFVPTGDYNGSANFKYKVSDGSALSNEATVTITVNAVNDPPVLDLDGSVAGFNYSTSYVGGSTGIAIADLDNSITDVDDTNIESASIILTNAKSGDVLNVPTIAGLNFNVSTSSGQITITVTGTKTLDEYEDAIRQITFSNPNVNLDTTSRNITVQVNDGNNSSNLATTTIAVSQGNTPPTLDLDPNDPLATSADNTGTFTENGAVIRFSKDAVSDPTSIDDIGNAIDFLEISFTNSGANGIQDGSNEQIRIAGTIGLVGGSIALNFANNDPIPDIVLGGITYSVTATVVGTTSTLRFTKHDGTDLTNAQAETLLDALGYYNSSENPTSGARVFNAVVNDGFVSSNPASFTVNVVPVNDAPSFTVATGKVVTDIGTNTIDEGQSVYLQPDGKILVGGLSNANGGNFALVRYNNDGSLDNTFGTGGKITANFVAPDDDSIFVQPDGKILVAGYSNNDIVVTRYNSNGTLDNSFGIGGTGTVTTDVGTNTTDFAFTLFVQADGKIVVSGESNNDFATVRYESNGTLDATFGTGGKVVTHVGSVSIDTDRAYSTFVQADGKIVVTGYSNTDFALARYNSDGTLDNTFGTGGKVLTNLGATDIGYSAFGQPDGKIILAGESNNNFALVRYNSDGTLDNTFGTNGIVTTDINGSNDTGRGVFVTQDGKILLTGEANSTLNSFALVRYNSDGTLDNTFGTGGKVITDIDNGSFDYAFSIFVQPDGKIIVVGESDGDFATVRYNSDGTLDTTFGEQVSTLDNNPTYSFGSSPVVLDGNVTLSDPELTARNNWNGATLTIQRDDGANPGDVFSGTTALAALGTLTNTGGTLSIIFNNGVTNAQVQDAIQQITYSNTEASPSATVKLNYTLNDQNSTTGGSGTAGSGQDQGTGGFLTGLGSITVDILKGIDDTGSATEAGGTNNGTAGSNATGNVLINSSAANISETGDDIYKTPASLTVTGVRTGDLEGQGTDAGVADGFGNFTLIGTYGTLTININGSYSYVVDDSWPAVEALRTSGNTLTDSFNYTLSNGPATDIAILTITIQGANDAPVAVADTATAVEAGGVNNGTAGTDPTGNVLSNDTDVDTVANGETKVVSKISNSGTLPGTDNVTGGTTSANGTVVVSANNYGTLTIGADGSYSYVVNNANSAVQALNVGGTLFDAFTYEMKDASGATSITTLTITINGANDAPTLDLDPTTDSYDPNVPSTANNGVVFTENGPAVAFTQAGTSIADVDGDAITSLTISFATAQIVDGSSEQLLINGGLTTGGNVNSIALNFGNGINTISLGGINYLVTGSVSGATSTLVFTKLGGGTVTKAEAETLLDALRYNNTSENPTDANRVFNLQVSDGVLSSNTASLTVDVNPVNDKPIATITQTTYSATEQVNLALHGTGLSISDIDAGNGVVAATLSVDYGQFVSINVGATGVTATGSGTSTLTLTGTVAQINDFLNGGAVDSGRFSYRAHTNTPPSTAILSLQVNDQGNTPSPALDSDIATATINITPVNDAPSFGNLNGFNADGSPTPSYIENGTPIVLDDNAGINDPELNSFNNWDGAVLTLSRQGGANAEDVFGNTGPLGTLTEGSNLTYNGNPVGTVTKNSGGELILTFDGSATNSIVDNIVRRITYSNTSENPPTSVTIGYTINDDNDELSGDSRYQGTGGDLEGTGQITVTIVPVNDEPSGQNNTVTTNEDTAYTFSASDFPFTDIESNGLLDVKISSLPVTGILKYNGTALTQTQIDNGYFVSTANLGLLTYEPLLNGNGANYASFTFQVRDNGGTANGGIDLDQSPNTLTINVNPVNDPPAGTDNSKTIAEDSSYTFAAVDFGFSDPVEGDDFLAVKITTLPTAGTLALSGNSITAGTSISVADIPFLTYTPPANANRIGATPYASFTFQVQDDGGTTNGGIDLDPTANTFDLFVTPVNDAPVATGPATLNPVNEDTLNPPGATVSTLFTSKFSDSIDQVTNGSGADGLLGIAIIGNAANAQTQGKWQYRNGTVWTDIPTTGLSDSSALYLPSATLVRFLPVANYNGTPGSLSVHIVENNSGTGSDGTLFPLTTITSAVNVSSNGGTTSISDDPVALGTTIRPVNDPPTIRNLDGDFVNYTVGSGAVILDQTNPTNNPALPPYQIADITDLEGLQTGGILNISLSVVYGLDPASNTLGFTGPVTTSGKSVLVNGITVGTIDSVNNGLTGNSLSITFNSNVTNTLASTLLQNITYTYSGSATGLTSLVFTVSDGGDGTGNPSLSSNQALVDIYVSPTGSNIRPFPYPGGTDSANTLYGNFSTAEPEVMHGKGSNDILYGYGGDDILFGDDGNDNLFGGNDNDVLIGGNGADQLYGEAGNDFLTGGAGKDQLTGGAGVDKFDYRNRNDSLLSTYDWIRDFKVSEGDQILVSSARSTVFTATPAVTGSVLTEAAIRAVLTNTNFIADAAALFTWGTKSFIALNDSVAGFGATSDAIIEITGYTGTIGSASFGLV